MMSKLLVTAIVVSASAVGVYAGSAQVDSAQVDSAQAASPTSDLRGWSNIAALHFPVDTPVAFKETRKTRLQRTAKTQSGTLWLDTSGNFVMSVTQPRTEERRLNNKTLSLKRRGKTRTTRLDPDRGAHQLLLSIVSVLQGDILKLKQNFSLENDDIPSANSPALDWSLSLRATNKKLQKELTKLTLTGRENRLLSIRAERGQSFQEIRLLNSSEDSTL